MKRHRVGNIRKTFFLTWQGHKVLDSMKATAGSFQFVHKAKRQALLRLVRAEDESLAQGLSREEIISLIEDCVDAHLMNQRVNANEALGTYPTIQMRCDTRIRHSCRGRLPS